MEIYGFVLTDSHADVTLLALKVEAGVRVYVTDKGNRLRKIYMDGFVQG
jgi:hypothetical protein